MRFAGTGGGMALGRRCSTMGIIVLGLVFNAGIIFLNGEGGDADGETLVPLSEGGFELLGPYRGLFKACKTSNGEGIEKD